jgi:hypothetical protein
MALLHPQTIGSSFPVAGEIPRPLLRNTHPSAKRLPEIHGFHGDRDKTYRDATRTVSDLRRIGFTADLRTYRGHGHEFNPAKNDLFRGLEKAVQRERSSTPPISHSAVAGKVTASLL